MTYGVSNGHVTDDVTWPPKELRGSTVGYPSDSLASCYVCVLWSAVCICPVHPAHLHVYLNHNNRNF